MSRKPNNAAPGTESSRNEYIPSFISKKPFYIDESTTDADYLEHQRLQSVSKDTLDKAKWYDRGKKSGPAATKFRKGACENCGAMTHKTKECLSRPRKKGAKWTGEDIQADEIVDEVRLGWDAKRDRWNGYDAREYTAVVEEYQELEELKRAAAAATAATSNVDQKALTADGEPTETNSDARYGEETDMGRSQPTSTRQLRLREDTAKYLLNLDLDSARYDPKTRSMDTSSQALSSQNPDSIADEGFVRAARNKDDAAEFERAQRYAWETQENQKPGQQKLHLQANPTEGEILRKKKTTDDAEKKAARHKMLLDKYGGAEHLQHQTTAEAVVPTPKPQVIPSSDRYVEYDPSTGRVKPNPNTPKNIPRSKYAEDVLTNNHTSVWGSWWRDFKWGYQCCHSTVKNSFCTGEQGKRALEEMEGMRTGQTLMIEDGEEEERHEAMQRLRMEQDGEDIESRKDGIDAVDTSAHSRSDGQSVETRTAKKRTLQEIQSGVTEEEIESYKRNRMAADDPMRQMLGTDELLEQG